MKSKVFFTVFCTFLAMIFFNAVSAQEKQEKKSNKAMVTFYVENMNCKNCQAKVEKNIAFEKGVTDLSCDLPEKQVTVTYQTDKTSVEKLLKAFEKIKMKAVKVEPDEKREPSKIKEKLN